MKTIIISPNQPRGGTQTKNETIIIAPSQPRGGTQNKKKTIIKTPSQPRGSTRTKNKTKRGAGKKQKNCTSEMCDQVVKDVPLYSAPITADMWYILIGVPPFPYHVIPHVNGVERNIKRWFVFVHLMIVGMFFVALPILSLIWYCEECSCCFIDDVEGAAKKKIKTCRRAEPGNRSDRTEYRSHVGAHDEGTIKNSHQTGAQFTN